MTQSRLGLRSLCPAVTLGHGSTGFFIKSMKSMVVRDLGGGTISTVAYGSKDPIAKTLKSFAIDLTEDPSLADLMGLSIQ